MDITQDTAIFPVLDELKECLRAALGDSVPCFCGITVGPDLPVEYIGGDCEGEGNSFDPDDPNCGVAFVRVVTAYPTENFPEMLERPTINSVMAYQVSVGVIRCTSVGDEMGGPPPAEVFQAESLQALSDMKAVRRAIQCCLMRAFPEVDHVLGSYQPIPREGGVFGGEWPVSLLEIF